MTNKIHDYVLFYNRDVKAWVVTFRDVDGNFVDSKKFKNQYIAARFGLETVAESKEN